MAQRVALCADAALPEFGSAFPAGAWRVRAPRTPGGLSSLLAEWACELLVVDGDWAGAESLGLVAAARGLKSGGTLGILLVATAPTDALILSAYSAGIDDFLPRPMDPRELSLRARAVIKRRTGVDAAAAGLLRSGGITLDPDQRLCRSAGRIIALRPREFELLAALMRNQGRVLTRAYLLRTVWAASEEADTRTIDVVIGRLRQRLGEEGRAKIVTISKMGYCFRPRPLR